MNELEKITEEKSIVEIGTTIASEVIEKIIEDFKDGIDYQLVGKKKTLSISGTDKVNFKFNLMPTFRKDDEVFQMLGQIQKGLIAFVCDLVDRRTNKKIGEGRGASILGQGDNCNTVNGAIKMAEIRAERDAVLRTFALRDRFTQDMEDIKIESNETAISVDNDGNIVL